MSYQQTMKDAARKYLVKVLDQAHWNITLAAIYADLNRTHLYELMERHGITKPAEHVCHCKGAHRGAWNQTEERI